MAPIVVGYWDIRGLAQPIRLLLEQSGVEWEDKLYSCGPPPTFDKTCWFGVKETLGFDFPNLPYLEDGDVKLTQTLAILRYLARKTGLDGKTEEEKQRVDMMEGEWGDFKGPFVSMCYSPDFDSTKGEYLKNVSPKLARFSKFLGDRPFFAGNEVTYVDFLMYDMLDQHKLLEPTIISSWKNLEQFCDRIESLPKIKEFMASSKFIKYPLNNKMASFGG